MKRKIYIPGVGTFYGRTMHALAEERVRLTGRDIRSHYRIWELIKGRLWLSRKK